MLSLLGFFEVFLKTGLIYSLLAMGYYVSYTILDFPDLTVEGTFLSGAVVFGLLATHGVNPWLALLLSFLVGTLCGSVTGLLHVKLHIRPLLCGILMSTALISLNLVGVSGGMSGDFRGEQASTISYGRDTVTLHSAFPANLIPAKVGNVGLRDLLLFLVIALLFKFLLDAFLSTRCGLLLRATGNNAQFVTTLSKDAGNSKILGLAIGNGFAAVSGALYSHISGNVNQSMGLGTIVIGLASLIIGLSVFHKLHRMKPTTKAILGAIIYQACLVAVNRLGVPSAYNKLIMAIFFVIALIFSNKIAKSKNKTSKTAKEAAPHA